MKTVRVRIAVGMKSDGDYFAFGRSRWSDTDVRQLVASDGLYSGKLTNNVHWVEADVHIPESAIIEGKVKEESEA